MNVSTFRNFNASHLERESVLVWAIESPDLNRDSLIDYSVKGTRLIRQKDDSLKIIPKTPCEVIGERILRPLLDSTYQISNRTFRFLKYSFSFVDNILSRTLNILPVAEAASHTHEQPIPNQEIIDDEIDTPLARNSPRCAPLRALQTAQETVRQKQSTGAPTVLSISSSTHGDDNSDISSPEKSIEYLRKYMGPIPDPEHYCSAEESISKIKDIKKPTQEQKIALEEAYRQLLKGANQDNLLTCKKKIMELFSEIGSDSHSYSIDALHPLPHLLTILLNKSGSGYTYEELNNLVTTVNDISRKMVVKLQKTNEKKALISWMDIMLDSAAKNTKFTIPTLKVALKVLRSKMGEGIGWEQKKEMRKMARWQKKDSNLKKDQEVLDNILKITGSPIWVIDLFHSYLECIPDDVKRYDEAFRDIRLALAKSLTFQQVSSLMLILLLLNKVPANVKNVLQFTGLSIVLGGILIDYFS
ncbi:MAG: hypothetical protein H0W88_01150 [Parachlamydiaceae bacterium]|nr:hypothetical protein [Parachlamydiaceae bacterium]